MSDLPRLLLCSFDVIPGPSGSSRRLTEYLKALPDRFSVVVLSAKTPDHSHIEKYQGARLLRVPVGAGDLASRIQTFERAVRRQLDSEEYALAHFTDPFGGYALCELKGDYGYRLIYEAQTFPSQELRYTHPQTEGDKRFLARIRRQELFCLMNADLVITGSQTTRTHIQSLGASTEQTRVIRAPVDLGPYTMDVLGAPDGQPMRLMYLGSQAGWQGLPTLLRALALVVEQGVEVKLTLVGPRHPDWQPHLEDLARELGIQEHVEFQPPVLHDDLVKVMALADACVLPLDDVDRNRLQGGPLAKVSEYFAAGRPVIAAELPVTRELLPDSAVVFYPPGDARALAGRIVELARDVPRRVELGREARAFAEQHLEAGLIRGQLLDIYDELLGHQAPVGAPSEAPEPTTTGTPTNRIPKYVPPESRRSERGSKSTSTPAPPEPGKGSAPAPVRKPTPGEDLPLVLGHALEEGLDTRLIKTEPDARPNEPPVVMGLPLREATSTPSAPPEEPPAPTPIIRTPAGLRPEEPEEPPTAIVPSSLPGERGAPPLTPTPIMRAPPASPGEAAPASSTRASASTRHEEPPSPTPIVPMKILGVGRDSGTGRAEPSPQRPPTHPSPSAPSTRGEPAQEPTRAQETPDKSRQMPTLPPLNRAGPPPEPRGPPPRLSPVEPPIPRVTAPAQPPQVTFQEEPEEIPEAEAQEISDDAALDTSPTPPHPRPRLEEPEEISNDEIQEADEAAAVEAVDDQIEEADGPVEAADDAIEAADDQVEAADDAVEPVEDDPEEASDEAVAEAEEAPALEPPSSALDPWFAQLAHGYCPPEGAQFARHTPPTNFPGRDEEPTDPSRVPAPPQAQDASRGKSS